MGPARNSIAQRIILLAIIICLNNFPAQAKYSGGAGEPNDPYQIATAEDLMLLGESPEDYNKHFILTADIDLDPNLPGRKVFDRAVIASDTSDAQSWFGGTSFKGVFNGNSHRIFNLTIVGVDYLGLFGLLESGASVSNLGIEAIDINGVGENIGGLAGISSGSITSSYIRGTIRGDKDVGGLVGENRGNITNSYSNGAVSGEGIVGGLVGYNMDGGSITMSYSTSMVTGNGAAGGLVGANFFDNIITSSLWDSQSSGLAVSDGGVGLTTAEMMDSYMLGLNGFANDPNWVLDAGLDYPRLAWEDTPGQIIPEPEIDWLEGNGTLENPYRIDIAGQIILLGKASILWDKCFVLGVNIDLDPNLPDGQVFKQAIIPKFTGVFDGNGHKISHLTITGTDSWGLFGQLGYTAEVKNLGIEDANIVGTGSLGSLTAINEGNITACYSTGVVTGGRNVGGLVGLNYTGNITTSYSAGKVSGEIFIGGLVGDNFKGSIDSSNSTSTVAGEQNAGGLVGENYDGSISSSYSTGTVTGKYQIGGLVGWNWGTQQGSSNIIKCYSTGVINGDFIVGGLVGFNGGYISTSYSTGAVRGDECVGGFAGVNWYGSINTSYSSGAVTGYECIGGLAGSTNNGSITTSYSTGTVSGEKSVGGLAGHNQSEDNSNVTLSFWDMETSGISDSNGGVGLTTAEMQDINTYLDAGWDFTGEVLNGTCDYWQILPGDYPGLFFHIGNSPEMPEGLGTPDEPYLIRDVCDFGTVWSEPLAHYRLAESIDLSGPTWCMAVIPWFGGTFDGNGYVISNLYINGGGNLGLIGQSDSGAEILNVRLEAIDVNGIGDCIGGLVGYNMGNVSTSYSSGIVTGEGGIGGLVGYNDGNITTSYSTGIVAGQGNVGGFVGVNGMDRYITNSYSSGTVTGESFVGGFLGHNYFGHIETIYSTCAVTGSNYVGGLVGFKRGGSIVIGFWDIETSGQTTSRGGTGKTTAEMQTASTFLEAEWDFIGETDNGTEDIWWIDEGRDYPRLWWELTDMSVN